MGKEKDLAYWKNNASDNYNTTPISVLRYITELENEIEQLALLRVSKSFYCLDGSVKGLGSMCDRQCDSCRNLTD